MGAEQESLEIKGPGGLNAVMKGERTPTMVFYAISVGALIYLGLVHHDRMEADNKEMKQAFSEMVYMMSLSTEERSKLRLDMPVTLRNKVRGGRGPRDD